MAWSVAIDGEVFRDTDFTPFTYPVNFPRIFEAISNQASTLREDVIDAYGVSMLTYYSAGDGDDYAPALRRALASGEKNIYIPNGNYRLASADPLGTGYAIVFRDKTGLTLRGASDKTTTFTIASATNVGGINFASCSDCVLSDFKIDCNRAGQSTTANLHGIRGGDLTRCRISRVGIQDTLGYGMGLQAGAFTYNTFEDVTISSSGGDGVDVKNNTSNNLGNLFTRMRISDWRRANPADAKAAFDTRGGVRITDSVFYLTDTTGYAANTPFLSFRPDEQASLTFVSAVGPIANNTLVTGASSGATGLLAGSSTNASTATVIIYGVVGTFSTNEILNFDNGSTARFASASYTVDAGGRDPSAINCRAYGPSGNTSIGIGFSARQSGSMFVNCVARNVRDGFKVHASTSAVLVDGCYAQFCESGYYLDGDDIRVIGSGAEGATSEAMYVFGQRDSIVGFRGRSCANGIRKQATSLDVELMDCQFQTTTSSAFPGSWTQGTFTAFNCPDLTNDFELNGDAIIGGSGSRVGFYGGNGATQAVIRGVMHTRALINLFTALSDMGLTAGGTSNGVVTGSPETVVSGNVGDIANRTDLGGHLYYKQYGSSGNTGTSSGWVPLRVPPPGTIIAPNYIDPRINFSRTHVSSALSEILGPDGSTYREYESNQPRFVGRFGRFTFEGERTNRNTNPRAEGAVAGNPGTRPTGWPALPTGVSTQIIGVVTTNGVEEFQVRFFGVPTTTVGQQWTVGGTAETVASATVVSNSVVVRLVSGTLTNAGSFDLRAGGSEGGATSFTPAIAPQTITNVRVLTSTSSGTMIRWAYSNTVTAVDFTLGISLPNREHAPFVSTPILPAVGNLVVSTRGADSLFASTEVFGVASSGACTIAGSFIMPATSVSATTAQTFFEINDGSADNRYFIRNDASTNTATLYRVTAGAASSVSLGTITPNALFRLVMSVDGAGRAAASLNGGTVQAVTGGPTSNMNIFRIGNNSAGSSPLFGQTQSLRLLNYGVTDAEIPAISANVG